MQATSASCISSVRTTHRKQVKTLGRACGWVDEQYLRRAVEQTIRAQFNTFSTKYIGSTFVDGKTLRETLTHDRRHGLLGDEIGKAVTLSHAYYSRLRAQFADQDRPGFELDWDGQAGYHSQPLHPALTKALAVMADEPRSVGCLMQFLKSCFF